MGYMDLVNALKDDTDATKASKRFYKKIHHTLPKYIYKYYSLNDNSELNKSKLECLNDGKIYVSSRSDFNDPYDDKGYMYRKGIVENCAIQLGMKWILPDIYPDYKRIACFTQSGTNNMSMWAHYANNHEGYCVEYAEENNFELYSMLLPVEYVKQKIDLTDMICKRLEMVRNQGDTKLLEDALEWCSRFLSCIKHESWESERELRFCCDQNLPCMPHFNAVPSKIYIGAMCSKRYEDILNQIGKSLSIPVYKMELDVQESEYILRPKEL